MIKLAIRACAMFFLLTGYAWGETISIDFNVQFVPHTDSFSGMPWYDFLRSLSFNGVLAYDDTDYSVTHCELTQMFSNDQQYYGGWLGPALYANVVPSSDGGDWNGISGIDAGFEWTEPVFRRDSITGEPEYGVGYSGDYILERVVLHPSGDTVRGSYDPPDGIYANYDKSLWHESDPGLYQYTIHDTFAEIHDSTNYLPGFPVNAWGTYSSGHVPEPATMLLLGTGLVGLAVMGRKRFKK